MNEALNFESEQLTNGIPCQNSVPGGPTRNSSDDKEPGRKINECHNKQNLLRCKGSSINAFPNSGNDDASLRLSSSNLYTPSKQPTSSKRAPGHFDDQVAAEPPVKRLNCVRGRQSCALGKNQPLSSLASAITTRNAGEYTTGMSAEPKLSVSVKDNRDFNFNSVINRTASNLSDGLRFAQNTTSAVSSPRVTDGRAGNLAEPGTGKDGLGNSQERTTEVQSAAPSIRSEYNDKNSCRGLLRRALSQTSIPKQSPECNRFSKDCLRRSCASEIRSETRAYSTPPVTPTTHFTAKDSSGGRLRGTKSPSIDTHTPKRKGFARESPAVTYLRTFTDERRCTTPRRFPGPAGILPPKMVNSAVICRINSTTCPR